MDIFVCAIAVCLLAGLTHIQAQVPDEIPCFDFPGNSYLHFTPNNFDNNNDIHYSLKFKTTESAGLLMYARGDFGDEEALYMRDGRLRYHLFNTSPSGVEGYFGGLFGGDEMVNTGDWVTVHVYRNWPTRRNQGRTRRRQTGLVVEMNGQRHVHVDFLPREDISVTPTIYLGGYRESLSDDIPNFNGQIEEVREEKNGLMFENPSLNYMSMVGLTCPEVVQPN